MSFITVFTFKNKQYWKTSRCYFKLFIYISFLYIINCDEKIYKICEDDNNNNQQNSNEEICLDNVIKFDNKEYRANNFAKNKKGDVILELTELKEDNDNNEYSSSRLFYGITKEGYPLFANNTSYTHEIQINKSKEKFDDNENNNLFNNYSSNNLFVSIQNDINEDNQYLFSINSHNSMVELFNLNNENNNIYYLWNFNEFFNLNSEYYSSFQYELFELKGKNEYIIAFIPESNVTQKIRNLTFIKRFRFKSFDEDAYEEINDIKYSDYFNKTIINVILLDNYLVVLYYFMEEIRKIYGEIYYKNKFYLKYYNYNLELFSSDNEIEFKTELDNNHNYAEEKLFVKSLCLMDEYVIFIHYPYIKYDKYEMLFEVCDFNLSKIEKNYQIIPKETYNDNIVREINDFDIDKSINDIIKINNNKIAFIYTSSTNNNYGTRRNLETEYNLLCILIFRLYIDDRYSFLYTKYKINLGNFVPERQILTFLYNKYLIFATTSSLKNDNYESKNYLSLFMMFGYPNMILLIFQFI